jgi:uridine kinase
MKNDVKLTFEDGSSLMVRNGSEISDIIKTLNISEDIIAVNINGHICESNTRIKEDSKIKFVDIMSKPGRMIYRSGLKFVYIVAIKELFGNNTLVKIEHSLDKGMYTELELNMPITQDIVNKIKDKMKEIVNRDININKITALRTDVIEYYKSIKEDEKVMSYTQMTNEFVTMYELLNYYNYFYSIMPSSTGILKYFDLTLIDEKGILLQYPDNDKKIPKYISRDKILGVFKDYNEKIKALNVSYVSDLNKIISDGKIAEFIQLNEIIQNEKLLDITDEILKRKKDLKIVLIGGPSCSGKTTSSRKLALYLKSKNISSMTISTDDYFKERKDSPKDEKGNYNFECLDAIDIALFNSDLKKLINYEEIKMPTFNFITGKKEYKKPPVKLEKNMIIIIEGLHTLNENLTKSIDRKNKFKIYASPFTPLSLDRHNHISTVDMRLLRRIVRDNAHRGYNAEATLKNWVSVRNGEEKYVFPFQNDADIVYNTASIYEIGVLKTYAEPLLYSINSDSEVYEEATRLINFLKCFFAVAENYIPNTSILREFVGFSYFE